MSVRTRFAPSPTGYLHVGGLRTALYNYLFAKQNHGTFILRIEDTDQTRLIANAIPNLKNTLEICKLTFDEYPGKGKYGPYIQSERKNIYKEYYIKLIKESKAYSCFFKKNSPENLSQEFNVEKSLKRMQDEPFVVKLLINKEKSLNIQDQIRGNITFDLKLIEDPIIIKSDGFPTYHFANVIDDHLMKITHVIRGEEWISSLPVHITLYNALEWDLPIFCHLPLLLNEDKSKLSKRQGDVAVEDFLSKGYLEDTLINFVALLGWHPSNDNEIYSLEKLIKEFSLNRVNKSGAIFDITKLNWMNSVYLKNTSSKKLLSNIINLSQNKKMDFNNKNEILNIIEYGKTRIKTLNEIIDLIHMFELKKSLNYNMLSDFNYKDLYILWINKLKKINIIDENTIKKIIDETKQALNISGKNIFLPLRFGLIGELHGPDLFTIINILGINQSIERLKNGI